MIERLAAILVGLFIAAGSGCVSVQGVPSYEGGESFRVADAESMAEVETAVNEAWPGRYRIKGSELYGSVREVDDVSDYTMGRLPSGRYLRTRREDTLDRVEWARSLGLTKRVPVVYEGPGAFIARFDTDEKRKAKKDDPLAYYSFTSGSPAESRRLVKLERTWFAFYSPVEGKGERGVALVIPGMFGTPKPVVDQLTRRLRENGWYVLRMLSHPSRFTERVTFKIDPDRLDEAGTRIAAELMARTAECAYAAQAMFANLEHEDPALASLPRVAIGMSGGGIVLPTVMAREADRYDAGVIIAGGSNYFETTYRSNYKDLIDAVHFDWGDDYRPTRDDWVRLSELYLEHAPLDSFHTAVLVSDKPMLMVHGAIDRAVPSDLGDQLWEQLGQPERRVLPVGHELLFALLPSQFGAIVTWLDDNTPGVTE